MPAAEHVSKVTVGVLLSRFWIGEEPFDEAYCFGRKRALPTTVRQAFGTLLLLSEGSTALGVGGLKGRHGRSGICGGQNFDPTLWHVSQFAKQKLSVEDLLAISSKTCLIPPTDTGT